MDDGVWSGPRPTPRKGKSSSCPSLSSLSLGTSWMSLYICLQCSDEVLSLCLSLPVHAALTDVNVADCIFHAKSTTFRVALAR